MGERRDLRAIILEDDSAATEMIRSGLDAAGVARERYEIFGTLAGLRAALAGGTRASAYFLDDHVPEREGDAPTLHFHAAYRVVHDASPRAEVFYTDPQHTHHREGFCDRREVRMIEKSAIVSHVRREPRAYEFREGL